MSKWKEASRIGDEIERRNPNTGPHGSHCWMNQYPNGCKYGSDETCLSRPKVWPHRTFDEDANIVLVMEDGTIVPDNVLDGFEDEQLAAALKLRGYTVTKNA